jgi:hypothetical protein
MRQSAVGSSLVKIMGYAVPEYHGSKNGVAMSTMGESRPTRGQTKTILHTYIIAI